MVAENLIGKRFGYLTVVERDTSQKFEKPVWVCKCDCGNINSVRASCLKHGTKSCGCYSKKMARERGLKNTGKNSHFYKHGKSDTKINGIYRNMKKRCLNPNDPAYKNYGGRGIKVCDEWLNNFENFYDWSMDNGYSESLTLDRIDVNGDYSPSNCRWITMKAQQNNRRNNVFIEYDGLRLTLSQWAEKMGVSKGAIYHRHERNYPVDRLLKEYIYGNKN